MVLKSRKHRLVSLIVWLTAVLGWGIWSMAQMGDRPDAEPAPGNGIFRTLAGAADFATGTLDGLKVDTAGTPAALVLDPAAGLGAGTDTTGLYNGGNYLYGTFVSPVWNTGVPVDSVVASWCADTPDGTWIEVDARALQGGTWTSYYVMGVWASGTATIKRHNAGNQEDASGKVEVDDLQLKRTASAVQLRALLFTTDPAATPRLRRLSVVATGPRTAPMAAERAAAKPFEAAWGVDLDVPERRQNDFPDGAGWCSPTSLSMLMAFWAGRNGNGAWDRTVP